MAYDQNLAQRMRTYISAYPNTVEKKMFGGIGYLINGNMGCGIHKDYLVVRINPDEYRQALRVPFVKPMDITGKPMKGWIMVSPQGYQDEESLEGWIHRGMQYAQTLPEK